MSSISDISIADFNLLCRICLKSESDMKDLFQGEAANMLNCGKFMEVYENDGLPTHICATCEQELIQSYAFKQKCSTAQSILKIKLEQDVLTPTTEKSAIKTEFPLEDESSHQLLEERLLDVDNILQSKIEFDENECLPKDVLKTPEPEESTAFPHVDPLASSPYKCSETYTGEFDLRLHESIHSPGELIVINCNKLFETSTVNKPQECAKGFADSDSDNVTKPAITTTVGEKYICETCGKRFTKMTSFKVHIRRHSRKCPHSCPNCNKIFTSRSGLQSHLMIHTGEKRYKCHVCSKSFIQSGQLTVHMRTHTGEKPFKCYACPRSFSKKEVLNYHIKSHTGEKRDTYMCPKCGNSFLHPSSLNRHLLTHSGEKPYICSKCGKGFMQASSLKYHFRSHTAEKPYACDKCIKRFCVKRSLIHHMRSHAEKKPYISSKSDETESSNQIDTEEKPHACAVCAKRFLLKTTLTRHLKIHIGAKPFVCSVCGKSFISSTELKTHIRIHTGERPYKCSTCGKSFAQASSLSKHIRTHSAEKFYACDKCPKRFRQKVSLTLHSKLHNDETPSVSSVTSDVLITQK